MLTGFLSLYIFSSLHGTPAQKTLPFLTPAATIGIVKKPDLIAPIIHAKGSIAIDLKTGSILFEQNKNKRMAIASITKLMTILIVLEENKMDEIVKVSNNAAATEGSQMQLRTGEEITVENLLYGALIHSANDAATALAEHNADTVSKFVEKMNARAERLGLINTHFSNPIGLDQSNNYSSAADIAKLSRFVYHNKFIQQAATLKTMEVTSTSGKFIHKLSSTNDLLDSYLKIKGLKTGKTTEAGLCLVSIAENDHGNEIITVVLDSPARFEETKFLVDWVFRAYNWTQ